MKGYAYTQNVPANTGIAVILYVRFYRPYYRRRSTLLVKLKNHHRDIRSALQASESFEGLDDEYFVETHSQYAQNMQLGNRVAFNSIRVLQTSEEEAQQVGWTLSLKRKLSSSCGAAARFIVGRFLPWHAWQTGMSICPCSVCDEEAKANGIQIRVTLVITAELQHAGERGTHCPLRGPGVRLLNFSTYPGRARTWMFTGTKQEISKSTITLFTMEAPQLFLLHLTLPKHHLGISK